MLDENLAAISYYQPTAPLATTPRDMKRTILRIVILLFRELTARASL
jgi:hypothetical protein